MLDSSVGNAGSGRVRQAEGLAAATHRAARARRRLEGQRCARNAPSRGHKRRQLAARRKRCHEYALAGGHITQSRALRPASVGGRKRRRTRAGRDRAERVWRCSLALCAQPHELRFELRFHALEFIGNERLCEIADRVQKRAAARPTICVGDEKRAAVRCLHLVTGAIEHNHLRICGDERRRARSCGAGRCACCGVGRRCARSRLSVGRRGQCRLHAASVRGKFCALCVCECVLVAAKQSIV